MPARKITENKITKCSPVFGNVLCCASQPPFQPLQDLELLISQAFRLRASGSPGTRQTSHSLMRLLTMILNIHPLPVDSNRSTKPRNYQGETLGETPLACVSICSLCELEIFTQQFPKPPDYFEENLFGQLHFPLQHRCIQYLETVWLFSISLAQRKFGKPFLCQNCFPRHFTGVVVNLASC